MSFLKKNKVSSPSFWNELYFNNKDSWNLNYPTPIFIHWSKQLPKDKKLKICIPGCGKSDDALYLSSRGHDVYGIDFSENATNYLNNKAKNNNIKLNVLNADFFNIDERFKNYFDVILEYTFFCAINPFKRTDYVSRCYNLLKKNGKLIGIFLPLLKQNNEEPPFHISLNEINDLFSKKFKINKMEYSKYSIESRKNNEIFVELSKKDAI